MKTVFTFFAGFFVALMLTAIVYLFLIANTIIIPEDMTNKQLVCELHIFEDEIQPNTTISY